MYSCKLAILFFCLISSFDTGFCNDPPETNGSTPQEHLPYLMTSFIVSEPFIFPKPTSDDPGQKPTTPADSPTQKCPHNYQGFLVDLLDEIGKMKNLQFCFRPVQDGKYGHFQKATNSWTGIIGEVMNGTADLGAAPMTIHSSRVAKANVTFTHPYMTSGLALIMQKPAQNPWTTIKQIFFVMKPLKAEVWIVAAVIAPLLAGLLFYLNNRLNPYEWNSHSLPSKDFGFPRAFYWVFTSLTWQGYDRLPRSNAGRLLAVAWFVYCGFFLIIYTSAVLAFIVAQKHETHMGDLPIRSLKQLTEQSEYKYSTLQRGASKAVFEASTNPLLMKMKKAMNSLDTKQGLPQNFDDAIAKVRSDKYAFIAEEHAADYLVNQAPCDLAVLDRIQLTRSYGFILRNELDNHVRDFDSAILELIEKGTMDDIYRKWWYDQAFCTDLLPGEQTLPLYTSSSNWRDHVKPLDLTLCGGPLVLLLIGLIVAGLVMVVERYFYGKGMGNQLRRPEDSQRLDEEPEDGRI